MDSNLSHTSETFRPIAEIFDLVGDKWTVSVLISLAGKILRFGALRRQLPTISQRMLASTLRELERDGLVKRTMYPVIPPRVEYELTEVGAALLHPITALGRFAHDHRCHFATSRIRFDEAQAQQAAGASACP